MLILTNSIVSDNMADEGGGGIENYEGTLILTNSIVSDNKALGDATAFDGGIANTSNGKLTLIDSTISGNTASGSNGGIGSDGPLNLINSTISGNTASTYGGGIGSTGPLTLVNSTISSNTASTYGGGIFFMAQTDLTFSTIYGNRASVGSDIAVQDDVSNTQLSKVKISNSIVAGGPLHPGSDISGTLSSFGYNLFQNTSGATFD